MNEKRKNRCVTCECYDCDYEDCNCDCHDNDRVSTSIHDRQHSDKQDTDIWGHR